MFGSFYAIVTLLFPDSLPFSYSCFLCPLSFLYFLHICMPRSFPMIQNPGKFTLQGTNTYLIGSSRPFVLFDVGEGEHGYIPLLESAILMNEESGSQAVSLHGALKKATNPFVSDIIISHRHHDHHGGLPSVLTLLHRLWTASTDGGAEYTPPRVHKFPLPPQPSPTLPGVSSAEREGSTFESTLEAVSRLSPAIFEHNSLAAEGVWPIIHSLHDKQTFHLSSHSPKSTLTVVHTPGHTVDSVCLCLSGESTDGPPVIFTADTVLGEGTAVFEELGVYLGSLKNLSILASGLLLRPGLASNEVTLYPGHGPILTNGLETFTTYIAHRNEREAQILALIPQRSDEQKGISISEIVKSLYSSYPPSIWPAAERGVWLHLQKLRDEGKVSSIGRELGYADEKEIAGNFQGTGSWVRS
ncbi:beta-lactamase-like protein [Cantharellus anzutake]|uniref:beta-lactamase-like protein n=1 Tax=Cantharellus anzutake TaxID=1750568 RepID=UPI00190300E6|nr:beta-lactamase-like protein [Cantharellus anzutake]KAF8334141.1 beta-lactamase-like protein [Cantharellus anzutake]